MKNQTLLILDLSYNQNVTNEGIKLITNALKMQFKTMTTNRLIVVGDLFQ